MALLFVVAALGCAAWLPAPGDRAWLAAGAIVGWSLARRRPRATHPSLRLFLALLPAAPWLAGWAAHRLGGPALGPWAVFLPGLPAGAAVAVWGGGAARSRLAWLAAGGAAAWAVWASARLPLWAIAAVGLFGALSSRPEPASPQPDRAGVDQGTATTALAVVLAAALPGWVLPLARGGLGDWPWWSAGLVAVAALGCAWVPPVPRAGDGGGARALAVALGLLWCLATLSLLPPLVQPVLTQAGGPGHAARVGACLAVLAVSVAPVVAGLSWAAGTAAPVAGVSPSVWALLGLVSGRLPDLGISPDALFRGATCALVLVAASSLRGRAQRTSSRVPAVAGLSAGLLLGVALLPGVDTARWAWLARIRSEPTLAAGPPSEPAPVAASAWDGSGLAAVVRPRRSDPALVHAGRSRVLDEASRGSDTFFAHLPLLFRDRPSRILLLGAERPDLLRAVMATSPVEVRVVEPSPALTSVMPALWPGHSPLADPRVRLRRRAAATALRGARGWDVILLDLPSAGSRGAAPFWDGPWLSALDTALAPRGLAAVRIPLAGASAADLSHLTAGSRIPAGALVWLGSAEGGDLVLLSQKDAGRWDASLPAHHLERASVSASLRPAGVVGAADFLARALCTAADLAPDPTRMWQPTGTLQAAARPPASPGSGALDALPSRPPPIASLFDRERLSDPERNALEARLAQEDALRPAWLSLLRGLARGDTREALRVAGRLQKDGASDGTLAPMTAGLVHRAQALLAAGQVRDAQAQLTLAIAIHPRDADAHQLLGRIALEAGDLDLAAERFDAAVGSRPDDLLSLLGQAEVARRRGDATGAADALERATLAHPSSVEAWNNLANTYKEKGLFQQATGAYRRALALAPRSDRVMAGLGEAYYFMALPKVPEGEVDKKVLAQALDQVDLALAVRPDPVYRSLRGQILIKLGRVQEAQLELMRVLLEDPEDTTAMGNLGVVFLLQGQFPQAREQWEKVLARDAGNAAAVENLHRLRGAYPSVFEDGAR